MFCPECHNRVSAEKAPNLDACPICRTPFVCDVDDVFKHNKYEIIKERRDAQYNMAKDVETLLNYFTYSYGNTGFVGPTGVTGAIGPIGATGPTNIRGMTGVAGATGVVSWGPYNAPFNVIKMLNHKKTENTPSHFTLIAEGGTGIGKSFAYLIPALNELKARPNQVTIIIATAKKSLQDQLYLKDLPYLTKQMRMEPNVVLQKGKGNYACRKAGGSLRTPTDRHQFMAIIDHFPKNQPVDISQSPYAPPQWWSHVTIDTCAAPRTCEHREYCKPRIQDADIIITNHHILALACMYPGILRLHHGNNILIVDEAHQFVNTSRSVFTTSFTLEQAERIQYLYSRGEDVKDYIQGCTSPPAIKALNKFFSTLNREFESVCRSLKFTIKDKDSSTLDILAARPLITDFMYPLSGALNTLNNIEATIAHRDEKHAMSHTDYTVARTVLTLSRRLKVLGSIMFRLQEYPQHKTDEESLLCTMIDDGIQLQPINIGPQIQSGLKGVTRRIFTSATLAVNNNFNMFKRDIGEDDTTAAITERVYPSVFNLRTQAIMYAPKHLPVPVHPKKPGREAWIKTVSDEIVNLVSITRGDAFVLFTSKADLEEVDALTRKRFESIGVTLIAQNGGAAPTFIAYIKTPNSVLYGLKSFWEGIDLQGDKLRLVIIPKLPFPNPTDPLIIERSKQLSNAFNDLVIPTMVSDMRQGVGRLIRSKMDNGIVAILDSRIWTGQSDPVKHANALTAVLNDPNQKRKGYGRVLLDTLGFTTMTDSINVIQSWANQKFKPITEEN